MLALLALLVCCMRRRRDNRLNDINPDDTDEWDGAAPFGGAVKRSDSTLGYTPQHGVLDHHEPTTYAAPVAYARPASSSVMPSARTSLPTITTTQAQAMAGPQPPSAASYHSLREQHFAQAMMAAASRPASFMSEPGPAPSYRTEQPRQEEAEKPLMAQRQSTLSFHGYEGSARPMSMTLQRAMDAAARRSVNYDQACVCCCPGNRTDPPQLR